MREKINFMCEMTEILTFIRRCLMLISLYLMYSYLTMGYTLHYFVLKRSLIALGVVLAVWLIFYCGLDYLEHKFWPQPLDNAIKSDHGKKITVVMERLRTENIEYRALFDVKGDKVAEGTLLSPNICNIPEEEWDCFYQAGLIDLHNHPNEGQVSFSSQDLYSMIYLKIRRSIVVTRSFTYVMENPYWNRDDGPRAKDVKAYADKYFSYVGEIVYLSSPHLYSILVSYLTAQKFGLKFHAEDLRFQKLKDNLKRRPSITPKRVVIVAGLILAMTVTITTLSSLGISRTSDRYATMSDEELAQYYSRIMGE